jgi:hypothetical protein
MYKAIRIRKEAQRKSAPEGCAISVTGSWPFARAAGRDALHYTDRRASIIFSWKSGSFLRGAATHFFTATVDGVKYRLAVHDLKFALWDYGFATHYDRETNEYNLDKRGNNNDSTMERYQLC